MNNNINNGRTSDALKIPGDVNYSNVDTVMGKIFNNDYNSKSLREITYRRMTRYWLENKHLWSSSPLPVEKKFVSFEPWKGGFNNIRMSLEMAAALAIGLNRTLVLPPKYNMYLRGESSFQDYFDLDDLKRGISTVTYEEFRAIANLAKYEAEPEKIISKDVSNSMHKYFKGVSNIPGAAIHNSDYLKGLIGSQIVYCIPHCPETARNVINEQTSCIKSKSERLKESRTGDWYKHVEHKLSGIDACDPNIMNSPVIHFPANLLGHFYTMVWFQNPLEGQRVKRAIRDHIHFKEEMFVLAERIIKLFGDFQFSCIHVRRNDFQFKEVWTSAEDIVKHTKRLFKPNEIIYVSTDELSNEEDKNKKWSKPDAMVDVKEHSWFKPFFNEWGRDHVYFLSDVYSKLFPNGIPKIWIGSVESIVCSRARVFVGTRKSTFSGYIHRMRGYMNDVGQKELLDAQAQYPEDYYHALVGPSWGKFPHNSFDGGHPYWGREYKESWEGVYNPFY